LKKSVILIHLHILLLQLPHFIILYSFFAKKLNSIWNLFAYVLCIDKMFVLFSELNLVLSCECYPQAISIFEMNDENWETYAFDQWETEKRNDGTFVLFCMNPDNCKKWYLQNSGNQDILEITPKCHEWLQPMKGETDIYEWMDKRYAHFALHIETDGTFSDRNIDGNLEVMRARSKMKFVSLEEINNILSEKRNEI
jgi:hypothetical protein